MERNQTHNLHAHLLQQEHGLHPTSILVWVEQRVLRLGLLR